MVIELILNGNQTNGTTMGVVEHQMVVRDQVGQEYQGGWLEHDRRSCSAITTFHLTDRLKL